MLKSTWNSRTVPLIGVAVTAIAFAAVFSLPAPELFRFSHLATSFILSFLLGIGIFLLLPRQKTLIDELKNKDGFGVDIGVVLEWLAGEDQKVKRLEQLSKAMPDHIKEQVSEVIMVTYKIFDNIKLDPASYRTARRVLGVYLDNTLSIMTNVDMLMKKSLSQENNKSTMRELSAVLQDLNDSFQGLVDKMVAKDTMRLDIELDIMKTRLETDGLTVREKD